MLEQFQFLDPRTVAVQHMIDDFVTIVGRLPQDPSPADLKQALDLLATLRDRLAEQFASGARRHGRRWTPRRPSARSRWTPNRRTQFDAERERMTESLADVETRFEQDRRRRAKPAQQPSAPSTPARSPTRSWRSRPGCRA